MNKYNIPVIINKDYYVNNSIDKYSDDIFLYHARIISNETPVIRAGIRLCIIRKPS